MGHCDGCRKRKVTKLACGRCKTKKYCSDKCLRDDWRGGHSYDCNPQTIGAEGNQDDIGTQMYGKSYAPIAGTSRQPNREDGWWKKLPNSASDEEWDEAFVASRRYELRPFSYRNSECQPFLGRETSLDSVSFTGNTKKYDPLAQLVIVTVANVNIIGLPEIKNDHCKQSPPEIIYSGLFCKAYGDDKAFELDISDYQKELDAEFALPTHRRPEGEILDKIKLYGSSVIWSGSFSADTSKGPGSLFLEALSGTGTPFSEQNITGSFTTLLGPSGGPDQYVISNNFAPNQKTTNAQLLIGIQHKSKPEIWKENYAVGMRLRYDYIKEGETTFMGDRVVDAGPDATQPRTVSFVTLKYTASTKTLALTRAGILVADGK